MDIYPAAAELIRDVRIAKPIADYRPHEIACMAFGFGESLPSKAHCAARAKISPGASSAILAAHPSRKRA